MKVLWITNNLLPEACAFFNIPIVEKTGWLHSSANQIKESVDLYIATLYNGKSLKKQYINGITYLLVPTQKDKRNLDNSTYVHWKNISKEISPDIIHIHGTEYPIGLAYINACGNKNVLISIQGLISVCANYYNAGLDNWEIISNTTVRDLIKGKTLWQNKKQFARQGQFEIEYINRVEHFIGRTDWDHSQISLINPNAIYHFNNETLRTTFYDSKWQIENVDKHTIFFSQATYPLKGLHLLLKAMPYVLRVFPDTIINIAGFDITKACKKIMNGKIHATTYGYYINTLIKELKLEEHVRFLGILGEKEMKDAYIKSHVFVSASSIENSSNSIGEAQLLGVPVVASFVGGTDTIVENFKTGLLYPFEDIKRLAYSIIKIFSDNNLASILSNEERKIAQTRHNKIINKNQLLTIYQEVLKHK